ncbi:hypothetical protein [Tissierella sp.]|uniref:hypothetical protein n=1 Tax=Tissierella sp. TaxID=41274 RepID=UPI00285A2E43|nr:hypothetical protein [Tissierella sp.]MDR7856065.1 hypothetical protein [Tissierella sp.]
MFKKHKQLIIGFLLGALVFGIVPVGATVQDYLLKKSEVKLMVDGQEFTNKDLPVLLMEPGYNYIPAATFREICDKLGVGFEYVADKKEIQIITTTTEKTDEIEGKVDIVENVVRDGYNIVVENGIEYVLLREVFEKLSKEYMFHVLSDKTINFEYLEEILIENMPYKIVDNKTYVEYEYLTNNILPLVK